MSGSRPDLLEIFLKLGYISPDADRGLRERAARRGMTPVEAALLSDAVGPDAKGWLLAEALGLPFVDVDPEAVPLSLADTVPESVARENLLAPIRSEGGTLTVAATDPFHHKVFCEIEERSGLAVRLAICPFRTVLRLQERLYPAPSGLSIEGVEGGWIASDEVALWCSRGGVREIATKILLRTAGAGMASIRVFPKQRSVAVTASWDGETVVLATFPLVFRGDLVAAFSDLAGLPPDAEGLAERMFHLESPDGVHTFRLSYVRALSGPEIIIRIIPELKVPIPLDSVGFNPEQVDITRKVLAKGDGLFLVSAPGSEGVATTLFAMLREIAGSPGRVVTVEESFRFRNDGYIQLDRKEIDRRFAGKWGRLAEALEPDALIVETAKDAGDLLELINLAGTGTVVFCGIRRFNFDSTLRTLLSVDVDPFLLARKVRLVAHQRLVNLLCLACRRQVPAKPSLRMAGDAHRADLERIVDESQFYIPAGCDKCGGSGYAGMMALAEILPFTPAVENIVSSDAWLDDKLARLVAEEFLSGIPTVTDLIRRGMVTFDDVMPFFR